LEAQEKYRTKKLNFTLTLMWHSDDSSIDEFLSREDVEKELERLEKLDIIEKVEGSTPWVRPIVIVPKKSGEVRICVDMREANKAMKREKHFMPTIADLIGDMNGATHFTTLDLSSG